MKVTLYYIKLHSGIHLPTTTIILPMNGVNSNLPNNSSQALKHFIKHLECKLYINP